MRVGQSLSQGDDGYFAVQWSRELLGSGENDGQVKRHEYGFLYSIGLLNEEICSKALLVFRRDKMIKADEATLEGFGGVVVKACEHDVKDCREVLFNGGTITCQYRIDAYVRITYTLQDIIKASRTSKLCSSVLDFPAMSFWKMPRIGSSWLFATSSAAHLGIIAESNLVSAGTFPRDSQRVGLRIGVIKFL